CTSTFEGTLLIVTTGRETITRPERTNLNPMGDRLSVPAGVKEAFLRIGDGEESGLEPGAAVEVVVEEIEQAPGVRTRVLVEGKERARSNGRVKVTMRWVLKRTRDLPPKEEAVPISLKRGETLPVNRSVMYVPVPGSRVWGTETKVEIVGPDRKRLKWIPEGDPVDGRVRGKVEVIRED
ncbi:MAG: hypothetical protein ACYTFG_06985, partial [Planctomycetota bacterium]